MSLIPLLLIGLAIAASYFLGTWLISVRIKNYGLLDAAWSYGVAVLAPLYALLGPGDPMRKWFITAVGVAWSVRLGTYILRRVLSHHPVEDARYQTLRARWPGSGMFLLFFQLQAVLVVIFSLPFLLVAFNTSPGLRMFEVIGLIISLGSLVGEATADAQMKAFKANPSHAGKVCQSGLWRYSRHPNYFFEFMIWVGFCIAALGSPWGWITVVCPLLMLHFLWNVTGIKLSEAYSLKSRGDAYREYQRTTSAFVPWFRKSGK
jgi:steroid 5-alpha reductase family enzyme